MIICVVTEWSGGATDEYRLSVALRGAVNNRYLACSYIGGCIPGNVPLPPHPVHTLGTRAVPTPSEPA
jgi:hypothetical protein